MNPFLWMMFLIGIMSVIPRVWKRGVEGKVHVHVQFDKQFVSMNEPIVIQVQVTNHSWLPCPMIHGKMKLPDGLSTGQECSDFLSFTVFLWMKQQIMIKRHVYAFNRGPKRVESILLEMNEGLGFQKLEVIQALAIPVYVYPKIACYPNIPNVAKEINGAFEIQRWLFPDEAMFRGTRAYESRDSMKHIHWKATAKVGAIMTKQFNGSTDNAISLIFNAQLVEPYWSGTNVRVFEELCSLTAAYGLAFEHERARMKFFTNAVVANSIPRSSFGIVSAVSIRRILARVFQSAACSLEQLLDIAFEQSETNDVTVIVTGFLTVAARLRINQMKRLGKAVFVLYPDELNDVLFNPDDVSALSGGL